MMPHFRMLKYFLLPGLCLCGCAHTATVHYWKPAELDAPHVRRVAVAVLEGEHAAEIAVALRERLEADQSAESAGGASGVETAAGEDADNGGRKRFIVCNPDEADAVIGGQVLAYGAADKDRDGSRITTTGSSTEMEATDSAATAAPGGELRVRIAEVKLALQMVDASTGEVLASRTLERNQEWGVTAKCRSPDDEEVLQQLTRQCVDEFMTVLQPQRLAEEVELASGGWYELSGIRVRRGVRLARRGRWGDAERVWQAALEASPECDAALFNLAVAAAQREAYDEAEEYAMRALRLRHTPCYAAGLDQLRRFRADADRIERQLPPPVITASHRTWDERP
jgi:tetratricopeptide (TPR) repeat protein